MNPFQNENDNETTELLVPKIKRNFKSMIDQNEPLHFRNVKQNLLSEFDESPTKVLKLPSGRSYTSSTSAMSTSASFIKSETPSMEKMKRELSLKEADIITLKAMITKWEKQVSKLESDSKEAQINHDKQIAKIKSVCDKEIGKSSELQSKLQYLMEKERLARDEMEELRTSFERQKVEMEKEILHVRREKLKEGDKAQDLRSKWLEKEASLREELMSLKAETNLSKNKHEEAEAQLNLRKRVQQDNTDQSSQIKTLMADLQAEKDKNKELAKRISDHEDNMVITKAFKTDLDSVPSMKKELENLRLDNEELRHNEQNTLLLEEELRSVKKKLENALATVEKFTELEVANEDLQARLQRWEASDSSGSRRPQSPSSLSRRVNELETSQAMMLLTQGDMESNLKREKMKLERAQADNRRLSVDHSAENEKVLMQKESIKRLKRKLLLLSKERDGYKSVLDSYESEVTMNVDAQNQQRIRHLEDIVKGYQHQSEETEAQMIDMEEKLSAAQMAYDKVQQQLQVLQTSGGTQLSQQDANTIQQLKEQVAVLENSLLKVQEEKDVLDARIEQRLLQGEYDPSKIKVVHLIKNPSSEVQDAKKELVSKLTTENDTLRKRNEILESNEGKLEDLTIQVNERLQLPSPTKELEAMKQELKKQETRNKRLMEVYTKTSKEFREICYQLTGYKIDIPCSNQYRLTNMYSVSSSEYLWFQQNEQGEIQMLQTDFSNSLKELMELYLQKQNSIPLFLSHITMDLYSKQTMILE